MQEPCAEHGIAADRFAREIVGFLKVGSSALAAAECQTVGPQNQQTFPVPMAWSWSQRHCYRDSGNDWVCVHCNTCPPFQYGSGRRQSNCTRSRRQPHARVRKMHRRKQRDRTQAQPIGAIPLPAIRTPAHGSAAAANASRTRRVDRMLEDSMCFDVPLYWCLLADAIKFGFIIGIPLAFVFLIRYLLSDTPIADDDQPDDPI
ncbi:MAG: hypothetical protein IPP13_03465 [Kouleothrix sp.]|nr:hypothetical protein [Kouleothrix sp.]